MAQINYEERYPTQVSHLPPPTYGNHVPYDSQPFASNPAQGNYPDAASSNLYGRPKIEVEENYDAQVDQLPEHRGSSRIFGMTRVVFCLVMALIFVIVAGAVGGGVGGALASREYSSDAESNCGTNCLPNAVVTSGNTSQQSVSTTTSEQAVSTTITHPLISTTTTQPIISTTITQPAISTTITQPAISTTQAAPETINSIAASTFQDSNSFVYIYLYYQLGTTIMYRIYPGSGGFSAARILPLSIQPKDVTSLAATAHQDSSGNSYVTLYYMDTSNNIIEAYHSCSPTSTTLNLNTNDIVSSVITISVNQGSSLAATYMDDSYGWRVYYQDSNGIVSELVGNGGTWSTGSLDSYSYQANSGSPIAVSMEAVPGLNVFYVDSSNDDLTYITYGNGWSSPAQVTTTSVSLPWNGNQISIAATAQTQPIYWRLYFVGTDRNVDEFYEGATGGWTPVPDHVGTWASVDELAGGIAAIGWGSDIRFYYVSGGEMVQAVLTGTTPAWSEGVI